MIERAAWAGKEKPPTPARESGEWSRGVIVIAANPVKAQGAKPRGAEPFHIKLAKAMKAAADAGYSIKVELGASAPASSSNVTPLEEWRLKKRDAD